MHFQERHHSSAHAPLGAASCIEVYLLSAQNYNRDYMLSAAWQPTLSPGITPLPPSMGMW
jgi:hypothetical protein